MRKLWSNITTGQSENLREQTDDKKKGNRQKTIRVRGVESQLRAVAQRGYPKDAEDPMVAPPDYVIRQSGSRGAPKTGISGYDQQICPGTLPSS